jgi:hypothetical protein
VRHFPGGIAVTFNDQLPVEAVNEDAKL